MAIPLDSTLKTLWEAGLLTRGSRREAEQYVRQVVGNMSRCKQDRGSSWLRIGCEGEGIFPNYRTEYEEPELKPYQAFRGQGHSPLVEDNNRLQTDTWSTRALSFRDVQNLLVEIRTFR